MKTFLILIAASFCTSLSAFSQTLISTTKAQHVQEEIIEIQPIDSSGVVLTTSKKEMNQEEVPVQIITEETKTENGQIPVVNSTARKPE